MRALYTVSGGPTTEITLKYEARFLIIERLDGTEIERWPLSQVHEEHMGEKTYLTWPPHPTSIQILDTKEFYRLRWTRQLSSKAHAASKFSGFLWLAIPLGIALIGLALIILSPKVISRDMEGKLFSNVEPFVRQDICQSLTQNKNSPLNQIFQRLFPIMEEDKTFSIQLNVVDQKEVNAFAFPGGKIFILDGLLRRAETPEEVAGVLAHEIEHVHLRHSTQSLTRALFIQASFAFLFPDTNQSLATKVFSELMNLKFSRDQEREADEGALERLKAAKIDVRGFQHFFQRLKKDAQVPAILSTHPGEEDRAQLAKAYLGMPTTPLLPTAEWNELKQACRKAKGKW